MFNVGNLSAYKKDTYEELPINKLQHVCQTLKPIICLNTEYSLQLIRGNVVHISTRDAKLPL